MNAKNWSTTAFLVGMLVLQLSLLAILLSGCAATSTGFLDRTGDFVVNIATATPVSSVPTVVTSGAPADERLPSTVGKHGRA
jgi:hypothetical protein